MNLSKLLISALVTMLAWVSLAFAAVDINSANETELDSIKGVGPAKAKAIVAERKKNGPFKDLDDVATRVKGIGDKTVAGWKTSGEVAIGGGASAGKTAAPAAKPAAAAQAPAKPETPKADAKAAAPTKAEAKKAEPVKAEAKKAEPAKAEKESKKNDKKGDKKDDKK